MKFTIKKEEFLKGLSRVQSVADRRNTMPILSNVLIESGEGGITVTATDLEIGLRGVYEAQVEEPGDGRHVLLLHGRQHRHDPQLLGQRVHGLRHPDLQL